MKNLKYFPVLILFLSLAFNMQGQSSKPVTSEFWVGGVCKHCKEVIETTLDVKGVLFSEYNIKNHTLTVVYKPSKITEDQMHQLLADAGHDTEKVKASEEIYNARSKCCQYRTHDHNHDGGDCSGGK